MGQTQHQQDFQTTGSQSSESHPFAHPESSVSPAKRGRAVAFRACAECRRKRAKCDGQRPCGRCQIHGIPECRYDVAIRQSKEELRTELQSLRDRQDSTEQLLSALTEPELSGQVLERLRAGQSLDSILSWANEARSSSGTISGDTLSGGTTTRSGSTLAALSEHATQEAGQRPEKSSEDNTPAADYPGYKFRPDQVLWPQGLPSTAASSEAWTTISSDPTLIRHLLALYFCWEYPIFASLSREHFVEDFHEGRHRYCSPLLVNSMLALGSRWSTASTSRPNTNHVYPTGESFFAESVRLLGQETDRRSLTTVQALGLMSMREMSCGRDAEGRYYAIQSIRLAVDMGLHRKINEGDLDLLYVQASTFWGAFSLDTVLSATAGSLPQYPHLSPLPSTPPLLLNEAEKSPWMPYMEGSPLQRSVEKQTSNVTSTYNCFCRLTETIHASLYALYSPVSVITSEVLLRMYTSYLEWYDQMPETLRLGLNSTPSVLFSHMTYHFAIIHLFRPFLDLQIPGSDVSPAHICHQAADAIQGLLRSYSQLYTLHRTPALAPCLALASAVAHLDKRIFSSLQSPSDSDTEMLTAGSAVQHIFDALDQDVADLKEMAACHYSAKQALGLIGSLSKSLKIEIEIEEAKSVAEDYGRFVKPYVRKSVPEIRRVEANGFLLNERRDISYLSSTQPPDTYG